jgi:hypothetical protein
MRCLTHPGSGLQVSSFGEVCVSNDIRHYPISPPSIDKASIDFNVNLDSTPRPQA